MNATNLARHRCGRRRRTRGVSPIIATILLVAITVVLAAVLYVLVSGLTKSGASTPYDLGMYFPGNQATGTNTYFDTGSLSPTAGLATAMFGLKVVQPSGTNLVTLPTASLPATCTVGSTPTPAICTGVTGDWYGLLIGSGGTISAIYTAGGWTYAAGTTTIALNNGYYLTVVTYIAVAGGGYVISAFTAGSSTVSGQAYL